MKRQRTDSHTDITGNTNNQKITKIRELRQNIRKLEQRLWKSQLSSLNLIYTDNFRKYTDEGMNLDEKDQKLEEERRKMPTFPTFITDIIGQPKSFDTTIEPAHLIINIRFSHEQSDNFNDYQSNCWKISIKADTKDGEKWGYGQGKYTPREYADMLEIKIEKIYKHRYFEVVTLSKLVPNSDKIDETNEWVDIIKKCDNGDFSTEYDQVISPEFMNYWKDTFEPIVFGYL